MVFQKRLDYGFNGYQAPAMPRATRSTRRRAKFERRAEDNQMCGFDLLATVAGKMLQENENPTISSGKSSVKDQPGVVEDCQDANVPFEAELSVEGSCDKKCFSHLPSQTDNQNCCLKESPHSENDGHSGIASIVTSSSCIERFVVEKLVDGKSHNEMENLTCKVKLDSTGYQEDSCLKLDGDTNKVNDELHKFKKLPIGIGTEICSFENPLDENPPLISLGGNAKLSAYNDRIPCSSLSKGCENVPVVSRDDDENFPGCTRPSMETRSFRPKTCIGDNRISKILASKFRKVAEKSKDYTLSNSDGDLKRTYHSKKNNYKRHRSQMNIPFKKRKLFHCNSTSNSNGFISSGSIYCSSENGMNQEISGSSHRMHKGVIFIWLSPIQIDLYFASGFMGLKSLLSKSQNFNADPEMSSLDANQHQTLRRRGSHVKLRIKSFRVPELFIEVPETATVGSLKRTVMDAVTAILGGGLRIGVILQGKKVRDDSKTLLQTGLSHDNQLDALGFTLEPNSSKPLPTACAADSPHVLTQDIPQPRIRYPSSATVSCPVTQDNPDMLNEHQVTSLGNYVESDHDSAHFPIIASVDKGMTDSKELVTVPEMNNKELAMVTMLQKSKQSEVVQRRIRRPFSVDEVEALVQAVEKLGTGRWRDVKLCAFDNAKYRTYVDLKDKWKTLVHTARISPQQRRGEPVPQELLDRVLIAHAYWSQQQTKQHKQPHETTFFNKDELPPARGLVDEVGVLVSDSCY